MKRRRERKRGPGGRPGGRASPREEHNKKGRGGGGRRARAPHHPPIAAPTPELPAHGPARPSPGRCALRAAAGWVGSETWEAGPHLQATPRPWTSAAPALTQGGSVDPRRTGTRSGHPQPLGGPGAPTLGPPAAPLKTVPRAGPQAQRGSHAPRFGEGQGGSPRAPWQHEAEPSLLPRNQEGRRQPPGKPSAGHGCPHPNLLGRSPPALRGRRPRGAEEGLERAALWPPRRPGTL